MSLIIEPKLLPGEALVNDQPGKEVQVKVGIASIYVLKKGEAAPREINIPIRLDSENSQVADLAARQNPTSTTDKDGYAVWRVSIKNTGTAILMARAVGYEPVQVIVVGEAEQPASEQITAAETAERRAKEKISRLEDEIRDTQSIFSRRAEIALGRAAVLGAGIDRQAEISIARSQKSATDEDEAKLEKAREDLRDAKERLSRFRRPRLMPDGLKPGDVLLTLSNSYISKQILNFE
jgi:hypothetical protein